MESNMPAGERFQVVRAGPEDIERLTPLFDAYRVFYKLLSDVNASRAFLLQRMQQEESIVFLAVTETGSAVGFTQLYPTFASLRMAPVWVLYDLYVSPDYRRQGIGRSLMKHAHEFAHSQGASQVTLATAKDNLAAQALYESLGYVRDNEFFYYELDL